MKEVASKDMVHAGFLAWFASALKTEATCSSKSSSDFPFVISEQTELFITTAARMSASTLKLETVQFLRNVGVLL
jgi:hypothetical protein